MSKKSEELKEVLEQMIGLTSEFEKEQNEKEEAITKLKYEGLEKKRALNEARMKVTEVEKGRQALETEHEEVKAELEKKSGEFAKLKKEHDRVKEVLSNALHAEL